MDGTETSPRDLKLLRHCSFLKKWPSRLAEADMPRSRLDIYLTAQENGRTARLTGTGSRWEEQLEQLLNSCTTLPDVVNLELPLDVLPDDCWL